MDKKKANLSRRHLLKALTVGGAVTAVVATTGISIAQAGETQTTEPSKDGYRETAHIRAYYNSLRS